MTPQTKNLIVLGNRVCVSASIPMAQKNGIFIPEIARESETEPYFIVEGIGDGPEIQKINLKLGNKVMCSKYEYSTKLAGKLLFFVDINGLIGIIDEAPIHVSSN